MVCDCGIAWTFLLTFFNNNFQYKHHYVQSDDDGNKLIVEISIQKKKELQQQTFSLINIYGPGTRLNFTKVLIE